MRSIIALSLVTFSALAQAQTPDAATSPSAAKLEEAKGKFDERFAKADTDHDGKLTPAEAKAGMPVVAKNFQAIDADGDGFVTKPEILAFMKAKRAERKGAEAAAPTP